LAIRLTKEETLGYKSGKSDALPDAISGNDKMASGTMHDVHGFGPVAFLTEVIHHLQTKGKHQSKSKGDTLRRRYGKRRRFGL
jgi:hypothetical protein